MPEVDDNAEVPPGVTIVHEHQRQLPPPGKRKRRYGKFVPTEDELKAVELAGSWGATREQIAKCFREHGIDLPTFDKHLGEVWKRGRAKGGMKIAQTIFNQAISGNVACMFFYMKCQGGWSERASLIEATADANAGVMLVPTSLDPKDWEKTVAEQQARLMERRGRVIDVQPEADKA